MAMNKKEQAEFDKLKAKLQSAYALHWTEEVLPDVPPPANGVMGLTKGWLFNDYSGTVSPACSSCVGHCSSQNERTTTQGARWLYSTKQLALRAMRYSMEKKYAEALARIDLAIKAG